MVEFVPFVPGHLAVLRLQAAQDLLQPLLADPAYGVSIAVPGLSWSGITDGSVIGCAGILPQSPGRAIAWALIGSIPARDWVAVTGMVRRQIAEARRHGLWRIEAVVRADFPAGRRWVEALGFACEGLMRAYGPDRSDCYLYARVDG